MLGIIAGAIGTVVSGAIAVTKALTVVGLAIQGLRVIGNAIAAIGKALGIFKPERDIEEIGDRALQAEEKGLTPDQYASYEAWVNAIEKDDWGYDPEKNKDMDPNEKVMKGIEVSSAVAIEKFPALPMESFFTVASKNPEIFTVERMTEIGKLVNEDGDGFEKVVGYITGTVKDHTSIDTATDILMDIEKEMNPGISDDEAYDRVASFYTSK